MFAKILPLSLQVLAVSASPLSARQSTLSACLESARLIPITSASSAYSGDIAAYNQRLQPKPAGVVYPASARDVSSAILCAASAGVPVSARSGGHSYASYGLGGTDGALVIDLSAFTDIELGDDGTAKVGAGNRLGEIALELNDQGRGLPHGTCPYVGVGGHASYGGFGLAGRLSGLLVDRIRAFDVVLANGTVLTNLTAEDDPDLMWALSGAAPNYGLVTSFYFNTFPVPPIVTNFEYSYYGMEAAPAATLFSAWQAWGAKDAPAALGTTFTIGSGGSVEISGVYYGSSDDFRDVFGSFVDTMPTGYTQNVTELSWIESLQALAGDQSLNTSTAWETRDDFFAKSLMTPTSTPILDDVLHSFFAYLFNSTTVTEWFVEVDLYGGANSAINSVSLAENSFGHRDKLLTFQMYASSPDFAPPYPEEGFSFLDGMYAAIVWPMSEVWGTDFGAYVNYVDPTLSADEVKTLYWASQYDRLSSLRAKYDPGAVFKNPQSIVAA